MELNLDKTQSALWQAEVELAGIAAKRAAQLRQEVEQILQEAARVDKARSDRVRGVLDLLGGDVKIPDSATFEGGEDGVTIRWDDEAPEAKDGAG